MRSYSIQKIKSDILKSFRIIISVCIFLFSLQSRATCTLSQVECPAFPSYSLSDLNRIYLANGSPTAPVHTDELQCIAAGKKMQLDCKYNIPTLAMFSVNGVFKSQTFLRSYLPQLIFTASAVPVITYSSNSFSWIKGKAVPVQTPAIVDGTINFCSISPPLPLGLSFNSLDCTISGMPTVTSVAKNYTVTATNPRGPGSKVITITVNNDSSAVIPMIMSILLDE